MGAEPVPISIVRLGAAGDGIGTAADGHPVFVPLSLPGETVRVRPSGARGDGTAAVLDDILEPSPDRIAPACPHFGTCGGCALQHWAAAPYLAWKASLLRDALIRAGFTDPPLAPTVATPPGARRRMDLAARRESGGTVRLGLHRTRGAEVIDLATCPVLHPRLAALIAPLRALLGGLDALRREASAIANLLDAGPDLLLRTDAAPSLADRSKLTAFAQAHDLPRISWARRTDTPEPICVLRPPVTALSGVQVAPPPGAFLQASAAGEAAILAAVLAGLPDRMPPKARIVELYAGCGTLTFALAARARVAAYEGDSATAATLRAAIAPAGLAGRIDAHTRDLTRQPLSAAELAGAAAVVLDPPQAGATAQMPALAAARPPCVIYVSCNPATLARDATTLRAAGYTATAATPIDQFLWSPRLESVTTFHLAPLRRG